MVFLNEATWDRVARVLVGIVMLYLGWAGAVGNWATMLEIAGVIVVATGVIGWCPAYSVCRFSTK
jgi:hypothetical protein